MLGLDTKRIDAHLGQATCGRRGLSNIASTSLNWISQFSVFGKNKTNATFLKNRWLAFTALAMNNRDDIKVVS